MSCLLTCQASLRCFRPNEPPITCVPSQYCTREQINAKLIPGFPHAVMEKASVTLTSQRDIRLFMSHRTRGASLSDNFGPTVARPTSCSIYIGFSSVLTRVLREQCCILGPPDGLVYSICFWVLRRVKLGCLGIPLNRAPSYTTHLALVCVKVLLVEVESIG